ncbi:23696_t:CDS:1, partial [Gigaspora margarita]
KKNRTCECCGYTYASPQMLRAHLNRKNPCQPQIIPTTNLIPIPQIKPEANNSLDQASNSSDLSIQTNKENTEASISSTSQTDEYLS